MFNQVVSACDFPQKESFYGGILAKLPLIRELLTAINEKDDVDLNSFVEKAEQLFRKEELETNAFLDEMRMWLEYLTGQSHLNKGIDRCLCFLVKCGLKMILHNTATPGLFKLLVNHIENIQFAAYDTTRFRCCQLIGFIFEGIEEIDSDYEPTSIGEERSLPLEIKSILVKVLKGRLYDKSPLVRAQVIRSVSVLCRICDDEDRENIGFDCAEYISNGLRDISRDVRFEAVRYTSLFSEDDISNFISAILVETDKAVRNLAFSRITCVLHVRSLTVCQRMQLLQIAFGKNDAVLQKIAERMIVSWAGSDLVPLLNLVQHLDFVTNPEICQQALMVFLKNYQRNMRYARTSEVLVQLRELCSAAQAEQAAEDDSSTCNKLLDCVLIDRRNYAELCQNKDVYVVASRVFVWRCLCDYVSSNAADEGDLCDSFHALLPDMVNFVDFLLRFSLVTWSVETDCVEGVLQEFIVFQLCLITQKYDRTDQIGMNKWRSALETIISIRDLPNSEKLLEFAVYELFELFYKQENQLKEFIEWCCYRVNSFLTTDLNETEELPLIRVLLVSREKQSTKVSKAAAELERHNIQRALLLLRTIMRNRSMVKVTTFLRAAFDQVIDTYCSSLDPAIWVPLCEVIGIGVAVDERIARERIHMLRSAIEVDGAPTRVKATALMAVATCAVLGSYRTTAQIFYPELDVDENTKGQMLLKLLEGFVFDQDEEISYAATESIARIIRKGCHIFPTALASCLLRYFDSTCPQLPYTSLDSFFNSYPSKRCINQHMLVGAARHALKKVHEAEDDGISLVDVDVSKMLNFVAKAVRKANLSESSKNAELKGTYPPQFFLVSYLLDWIIGNAESNLSAVCLAALASTSPEEFSDLDKALSCLLDKTKRCIDALYACELYKLIPFARRFERRLIQCRSNEESSINDSNIPSKVLRNA